MALRAAMRRDLRIPTTIETRGCAARGDSETDRCGASSSAILALVGRCWRPPAPASANPSMLFDVKTGQVLDSEDAFQRWYPASLTKLMTTYVAFRADRRPAR